MFLRENELDYSLFCAVGSLTELLAVELVFIVELERN